LTSSTACLVSARERWGALNFYENQPFPFRWATAFDAIISKRFSPGFTLALRHSDYHTVMMGTTGVNGLAPFATFLSPNCHPRRIVRRPRDVPRRHQLLAPFRLNGVRKRLGISVPGRFSF